MSAILIKYWFFQFSFHPLLIYFLSSHLVNSQVLNYPSLNEFDSTLMNKAHDIAKATNTKPLGSCTICRQLTRSFKLVS